MTKRWIGMAALCAGFAAAAGAAPVRETVATDSDWVHDVSYEREEGAADGTLTVRFGSLERLVGDLRAQALGNVLASTAPPLTRAMRAKAEAAFRDAADADGRTSERFEIVTLSGWQG